MRHRCQCIQIPDTPAVVSHTDGPSSRKIQFQGHPLWNEAKMPVPEADALFIRDEAGKPAEADYSGVVAE